MFISHINVISVGQLLKQISEKLLKTYMTPYNEQTEYVTTL